MEKPGESTGQRFSGITASPLIEDELLILYMCGKPAACVVAFDKNSGKGEALDDSFTYSSPIILTAGGRKQLIAWTREAVTSLIRPRAICGGSRSTRRR